MNKRGLVDLGIVFLKCAVVLVVAAIALRGSHIERRANEKCIADGGTVEACKAQVDAWTKEERLDYIRDDAPAGNGGNFVGGNSN